MNIDPFVVRQRIYRAAQVPPPYLPFLHTWACMEDRKCGHEIFADLSGRLESESGLRQFTARALKWYEDSGLNFGSIISKKGQITHYGAHFPNRAVFWILDQLKSAPDHNPITGIDRFLPEAFELFHLNDKPKKKNRTKPLDPQGRVCAGGERSCITIDTSFLPRKPRQRSTKIGPLSTVGQSALILAAEGFEVFPCAWAIDGVCQCWRGADCKAPSKHPFVVRWQQLATTRPAYIYDHWVRNRQANPGVKMGTRLKDGGYLMGLDVDPRHFGGGALATLIRDHGPLPSTRRHSTPSGGYHDLFSSPIPFQSKSGLLGCGLDVKCLGGFLMGPGSVGYAVNRDLPIATLPPAWVEWVQKVWIGDAPLVAIGERNETLTRWCGAMIGSDGLSEEAAFHVLKHRRDHRCVIGPPFVKDDELRAIVKSVIAKEKRQQHTRRIAA